MGAFFFTVHLRGNDVERTAAQAAGVLAAEVSAAGTAGVGADVRAAIGRAEGDGWLTMLPALEYDASPVLAQLSTALAVPLLSTVTADSDVWFATVYAAGGGEPAGCASNSEDPTARERLRTAVARCFGVELDDAWLHELLRGRRIDEERRMDAFARALGITSAPNGLASLRAGRLVGIVPATLRYLVAPTSR